MINKIRKAKLQWHCRRGILELDLMLQRFCESYINKLNDQEIISFELLLEHADQELYLVLLGRQEILNKDLLPIVKLVQFHSKIC